MSASQISNREEINSYVPFLASKCRVGNGKIWNERKKGDGGGDGGGGAGGDGGGGGGRFYLANPFPWLTSPPFVFPVPLPLPLNTPLGVTM